MNKKTLRIAEEILKIAEDFVFADSDYEYIYDPDHKKKPSGGYHKTEKGWSKKEEKKEKNKNPFPPTKMSIEQEELDADSKNEDSWFRKNVAENENAHEITLHNLAFDKNYEVRAAVAYNPSVNIETLKILSKDKDEDVRIGVASNIFCPIDILNDLSKDKSKSVVQKAKENFLRRKEQIGMGYEEVIIDNLSYSDNEKDRMNASQDYYVHFKTLDKLSQDKSVDIRRNVAENKNTSPETLDKLSNDEDEEVRWTVAENPNTSIKTLKKLLKDWHEDVVSCAEANLAKKKEESQNIKFDITKLSPEMREKVKDWDAEDIAKFLGWLKEHKD